jgi:hypothetical protein
MKKDIIINTPGKANDVPVIAQSLEQEAPHNDELVSALQALIYRLKELGPLPD